MTKFRCFESRALKLRPELGSNNDYTASQELPSSSSSACSQLLLQAQVGKTT